MFDLGIVLRGNSLAEARETRLRRQLQANPKSALAAVNLAAVLMQRGEYDEAEKWLQQAMCAKAELPDNGRRARMLLNEMQRRRAKSPIYVDGRSQLGANLSTSVRSVDEMTAVLAAHTPRMFF
ncbi:MAG: tetratricopeptide repeat protein [Caldilineaceae bacterium]